MERRFGYCRECVNSHMCGRCYRGSYYETRDRDRDRD